MRTLNHQSLGRYQLDAEIGRGAMGVVYRARDPKIDRIVAIKTISLTGQTAVDESEYRERFVQEARAAGRLSHPGIVTIFDAGESQENHEPYLVMEYVAGQPLSKVISQAGGKLPVPIALQFALEIAEALSYAHSQGVIHRDIKPANILVTEDGHAKIADFGVARLNQEAADQAGQIVGSPAYMAPEQMSGGPADARSDLFSLGVILYSMITGFRPFQGNSAQTVCFKVMNFDPVPVTSFQHDVPPEVDAIISRAMAKDPDERYQSGAQMAHEIQQSFVTDDESAEDTLAFGLITPRSFSNRSNYKVKRRRQNSKFFLGVAFSSIVFSILLLLWRITHVQNVPLSAAAISDARPVPQKVISSSAARQPLAAPVKPVFHRVRLFKRSAPKSSAIQANAIQVNAAQPLAAMPARVEVEIQHRFKAAKASIWVDDQIILDHDLRGTNQRYLLRVVEMTQMASFQLAAGKHRLRVRVVSPASTYDQTESLDADLSSGSEHILQVNCDKKIMQVVLQ